MHDVFYAQINFPPIKQLFGGTVYKMCVHMCFAAQIRFCCESD